jgi:hypothetical protein
MPNGEWSRKLFGVVLAAVIAVLMCSTRASAVPVCYEAKKTIHLYYERDFDSRPRYGPYRSGTLFYVIDPRTRGWIRLEHFWKRARLGWTRVGNVERAACDSKGRRR